MNREATLSSASGGTLQVNTITGISSSNTLTIGGLGTVILSGSADNTNLTINATSGTLVLAKTNSGPGGFGAGVRSLGGTLTVAGAVVQLGGTGQGGSTTSVDQIYDGASVVVNSGKFDLNGRSETISGFSGSGGNVTNTASSTTATLTVGYNGAGGTYSGTLQDGGSGKVLALTKEGAGTLTLTGTSTYSGATSVTGGALVVNGSLASSSLTVGSAGTLGGTGAIAGDTTIEGTHNPGNSPGIQTFGGNLTYSGGLSAVNWELSANTTNNAPNPNAIFDTVVVAGNLSFGGLTELNLSFKPVGGDVIWSDPFWQTSKTGTNGWLVYDVAGTINIFSNLHLIVDNWQDSGNNSFDSALGGSYFSLYQSGTKIYLDYTFNTVTTPEPSSGVAMAVVAILGGAVFLVRRRRVQS